MPPSTTAEDTIDRQRIEAAAQELRTAANGKAGQPLPSYTATRGLVKLTRELLFPQLMLCEGSTDFEGALTELVEGLTEQIRRALCYGCPESDHETAAQKAEAAALDFVDRLPELRSLLHLDLQAAYNGDPALHSIEEAKLCYPGVFAVTCYRIAHVLFGQGIPLLPRMITEFAHSRTGIDIHPGAQIGESFFIDHGTGVVIGETAIVGRRVRIYQGVTLGAKSFPVDAEGRVVKDFPRHPIVEDDVIIYACATLLGRITIGREAVVGGNVWITKDVPAGSLVTQVQSGAAQPTVAPSGEI